MSMTVALSMAKTLGALLLVLGCFFLLARLLQRIQQGGRGQTGQMQVVSAMPVGHRERVVLVRSHGKLLMLGVAPGRVSPLHVFDDNDQPFEESLKKAERKCAV